MREQAVRWSLSSPSRHAFDWLSSAKHFAPDYVGAQGWLGENARSFQVLLGDPQAATAFEQLATSAGVPRLYGLAGLYFTNPAAYRCLALRLRSSDEVVETIYRANRSRERVSRLIDRYGSWRAPSPEYRLARARLGLVSVQVLRRRRFVTILDRGLHGEGNETWDFVNGQYPLRLLRAGRDPFDEGPSLHEIRQRFTSAPKRKNAAPEPNCARTAPEPRVVWMGVVAS